MEYGIGGPSPEEAARAQAIRDSDSGDATLDINEQQRLADAAGVGDAYRAGIASQWQGMATELGGVVTHDQTNPT